MSELKKELEQDKAFIEEVADRIYSDTDDIEESMPDPEWIERMTDIADKYITRFETSYNFANNLADELLASNIQLNDNEKVGIIYSQLIEEFGFGYSEKDLWMIAENIYEKIASQQPQLNDDQKNELKKLKNRFAWFGNSASHALFDYMTDNSENIKKHNIGDRVTSTYSILLDKGFRGVTGTIKKIVLDEAGSWQYLIQLDDGRELQCDDWHLEQPQLNDNQKIVLEYLKSKITESSVNPISAIVILGHLWEFRRLNTKEERRVLEAYWQLNSKQQAEVIQVFSAWVLEQEEAE